MPARANVSVASPFLPFLTIFLQIPSLLSTNASTAKKMIMSLKIQYVKFFVFLFFFVCAPIAESTVGLQTELGIFVLRSKWLVSYLVVGYFFRIKVFFLFVFSSLSHMSVFLPSSDVLVCAGLKKLFQPSLDLSVIDPSNLLSSFVVFPLLVLLFQEYYATCAASIWWYCIF